MKVPECNNCKELHNVKNECSKYVMKKKSILEKLHRIWIKKQFGSVIAVFLIMLIVVLSITKITIPTISIIILIVSFINFVVVFTLGIIGRIKKW